MRHGAWTVEWFGTATFRARRPGLDLFFDGYLDRVPGLDPVGLSVAEVTRADFLFVSHAHFDHLYGVAPIARSTGATVVASPESARILRQDGVPDEQLLMVTGARPCAAARARPCGCCRPCTPACSRRPTPTRRLPASVTSGSARRIGGSRFGARCPAASGGRRLRSPRP